MRTFFSYLIAIVAVATGVWFGYFANGDESVGAASRRATAVPVITTVVQRAPFRDSLQALGTARSNESVRLTANRTEMVTAVHFEDGQEVEAGDLLIELEVAEEVAGLAEAQALLAERHAAHARAEELFQQNIAPQSEIDTAMALLDAARARVRMLEAAIKDHEVRAPFRGQLGLRNVSVGALLQGSTEIATLDDLSEVKVDFTIPETWLSAVLVGMPITARTDAWPGRTFAGVVSAIDTRLDRRTRSATVRARVPNPDRLLRPGMLIKVSVDRGEAAVLQVPEDALQQVEDRHYVYIVDEGSHALQVQVRVGRRRAGFVEVLDGEVEGKQVVVEGIVRVRDGEVVEVVGSRGGGV